MKHGNLVVLAAALCASPAFADYYNAATGAPVPYTNGWFELPQHAAWGGWTRSAGDTLWVEFDVFNDATYPGDRTSAPVANNAYAHYGVTADYIAWDSNTFPTSTKNLISPAYGSPQYTVNFTDATPIAVSAGEQVRVVMQIENWANELSLSTVKLNGLGATFMNDRVLTSNFSAPYGDTSALYHLVYWDLDVAPTSYVFTFGALPDQNAIGLAQVAIDVGTVPAVPEPEAWAMLLAGLGLTGAVARRRLRASV